MKSMFGHKDKLEGTVPDEFLADVQIMKATREYTVEVVKYIEKMVRTAIPPANQDTNNPQKIVAVQTDELQRLSKTCDDAMHYFYQQRYYYVLKATSEICTQLSKRQKQMIQEIHDRAMMPLKVWVDEDYSRFVRDLQKCQKLKKERDAAVNALANNPTPQKGPRAIGLQEQYELCFKLSKAEVEKTRKIRKHHANCLKLMATLHHKYSMDVLGEIEKAQGLLVRQLADLDDKEQKEQTIKTEPPERKTQRSTTRTKETKDSRDSKHSKK